MAAIRFKAEIGELVREIDRYGAEAPKAEARALTNAVKEVKSFAVDRLADVTGLEASLVGKQVGTVKATPDVLKAELVVSGVRIDAFKYGAIEDPTGVTYQSPVRGSVSIAHAFIARMRSGHLGVFRRAQGGRFLSGRGRRRHLAEIAPSGLVERLPIAEMKGPSLGTVFEVPAVVQPVVEEAERAMKENLEHELDVLSKKAGR